MSAIDPTPSTVATNALQGIPFSAIIGGPLQAAIEAQSMAAQSTVNFIETVGFQPGPNGTPQIVQVTFSYQQGSQMMNLSVPLLAIVPIPYLAVTNITIDFTASINASSSSVASQSSDSQTTAGGSVGYSGWGLTANFNASYSSKQSSTASQQSKYSVEYTLTIHVEAEQEDMPQGLQQILNILSNAATSSNPSGSFSVQVPQPTPADGKTTANVTGVLLGPTGLGLANATVTIAAASGQTGVTPSPASATTASDGSFSFTVTSTTVGNAVITLSAPAGGANNATATINVPFVAAPATT